MLNLSLWISSIYWLSLLLLLSRVAGTSQTGHQFITYRHIQNYRHSHIYIYGEFRVLMYPEKTNTDMGRLNTRPTRRVLLVVRATMLNATPTSFPVTMYYRPKMFLLSWCRFSYFAQEICQVSRATYLMLNERFSRPFYEESSSQRQLA